ncbi:hypothetical protein AB0C45_01705 [Streptomyces cyaneofuscatus]
MVTSKTIQPKTFSPGGTFAFEVIAGPVATSAKVEENLWPSASAT